MSPPRITASYGTFTRKQRVVWSFLEVFLGIVPRDRVVVTDESSRQSGLVRTKSIGSALLEGGSLNTKLLYCTFRV